MNLQLGVQLSTMVGGKPLAEPGEAPWGWGRVGAQGEPPALPGFGVKPRAPP